MTDPGHSGRFPRSLFSVARADDGFTLVELMVVIVVIGALVAIAIPNFVAASNRAKEASLKANMHAFQFVSEDYLIKGDSTYAVSASDLAPFLLPDFANPFDLTVGSGKAWEDRASYSAGPAATPGITSYADSNGAAYNIKAYGAKRALSLVLSSGTR